MPSALEGVTVLDMASEIAGPYACMLLACMGARVIKVEPPGGSPERADPRFYLWNRGKESVTLDMAQPSGVSAVRRLASKADLLVHNWRPVEASALGLDYNALRAAAPRLIYCSVPPYPSTTPLAGVPGDHYTLAAAMGVFGNQGAPDGPSFTFSPLVAYGTAFTLCLAASAALFARENTGTGQQVEVSLLHGAMAIQSAQYVASPRFQQQGSAFRQGIRVSIPVYRLFKAQDGWFFLSCGNNTFFNKLCILLGRPDIAADERYTSAPWGIPPEHYDALADILEPIFASNTVAHWLQILSENDIPCAPVQDRVHYTHHSQVPFDQTFVPVEDAFLGSTLQPGVPVWLHGSPGAVRGPCPTPGRHTAQVLTEFGIQA